MIRRFDGVLGQYIEMIPGQDRLAFGMTDTNDIYDLVAWSKLGGYQGSVVLFHDLTDGRVHRPFEKRRDVVYANPVYADGWYYILCGDYANRSITLYRWRPDAAPEVVVRLSADDVELYNLRLIGNPVHIVSQRDRFECYWPQRISLPLDGHESVTLIEDGRVYVERWVEEGWDDENGRATDEYRYYNRVIVRDFDGNTLSDAPGSLFQAPDGTWWIA